MFYFSGYTEGFLWANLSFISIFISQIYHLCFRFDTVFVFSHCFNSETTTFCIEEGLEIIFKGQSTHNISLSTCVIGETSCFNSICTPQPNIVYVNGKATPHAVVHVSLFYILKPMRLLFSSPALTLYKSKCWC